MGVQVEYNNRTGNYSFTKITPLIRELDPSTHKGLGLA